MPRLTKPSGAIDGRAELPPHPLRADSPPHPLRADSPPHPLRADSPPHPLRADSPPHPLWQARLHGSNLVEASAGTGKTWTITGLYLRLIVESGLEPRDILTVTFTLAATAELKERVRTKLVALRERLASGRVGNDPLLEPLAARVADPAATIARLTLAVDAFDEAMVLTIHGFCQRMLVEHAFECGLPLAAELLIDESAIRREAAEDWWRRAMHAASPIWLRYLMDRGMSPSRLLDAAMELSRPGIGDVLVPAESTWSEAAWLEAYRHARTLWQRGRGEIEALLATGPLNRNRYRPASVQRWCLMLDRYFDSDWPSVVLAIDAGNDKLEELLVRFTTQHIESAVSGHATVRHPFFDAATVLLNEISLARVALSNRLAREWAAFGRALHETIDRRKLERRRYSYDDLIARLHAALHGAGGDRLADRIRRSIRAALIDEFQDTDTQQYAIFRRLFVEGNIPLFLVGDPKQAIYAFRGADVFAYLAARGDADAAVPLTTNRRSTPALVDAVNRMFAAPQAFVLPAIGFEPATAADRGESLEMEAPPPAPLTIWWASGPGAEPMTKEKMRAAVTAATVDEITRLLAASRDGAAHIAVEGARRPLSGRDIAVIVRKHDEASAMRDSLAARGIASVTFARQTVYASEEAEMLETILAAVTSGDEALVRGALATRLFGRDLSELIALEKDPIAWERLLDDFTRYREALFSGGVMRLWREIVAADGLVARALRLAGGARMLTNLAHLVELLHQRAVEEALDPAALRSLLGRLIEQGYVEDESAQLRLDSDESLVRLLTVHAAKGLEFPIVFCPALWDGKLRSEQTDRVMFHAAGESSAPTIDLGSAEFDAHRELAVTEELAESVRLAYVALTRARLQCYVAWGIVNEAASSPLAWLLHRDVRADESDAGSPADATDAAGQRHALAQRFAGRAATLEADLVALAARSKGAVAISAMPSDSSDSIDSIDSSDSGSPAQRTEPASEGTWWPSRQFQRTGITAKRIASFTSLVARGHADRPDYDASVPSLVRSSQILGAASSTSEVEAAFRFPRGARAGTCLHAILERVFAQAGRSERDVEAPLAIARQALIEHGLEEHWAPVATDLVRDTLQTPIDGEDLRLASIRPVARAAELEFHFPITAVGLTGLDAWLRDFRGVSGLAALSSGTASFDVAALAAARGYMKGFIDLVFTVDGRYYIADYKSNWLGDRVEDYAPSALAAAVVDALYDLQYGIYSLALDRLLAQRLPGYQYDQHFGGVYYLFMRGMRPALGAASGVHFARPAAETIVALGALLDPTRMPARRSRTRRHP